MPESRRLFVVVNHGAARARRAWPVVRAALAREGISFEAHESVRPGETESRTRAALAEGCDVIAVVGGDGTLSAAASGYFEPCGEGAALPRPVNPTAALALLPAGTGDDFARGLASGRREPLESWLGRLIAYFRGAQGASADESVAVEGAAVFRTRARSVDVLFGTANDGARPFLCLNAATLGIGAEVAARVAGQGERVRRLSGETRFALAAVQSLAAWRNRRVRIEVDGSPWVECRTNLIAVVNGPYAGGGMNFAPEARVCDGRLEVLTACGLSRPSIVRELARVHRAGHLSNPKVRLATGTRVRIETADAHDPLPIEADGDPRGLTPVNFVLMPGALRVLF
jgi:diacylglycerol kinase (ATP)